MILVEAIFFLPTSENSGGVGGAEPYDWTRDCGIGVENPIELRGRSTGAAASLRIEKLLSAEQPVS